MIPGAPAELEQDRPAKVLVELLSLSSNLELDTSRFELGTIRKLAIRKLGAVWRRRQTKMPQKLHVKHATAGNGRKRRRIWNLVFCNLGSTYIFVIY